MNWKWIIIDVKSTVHLIKIHFSLNLLWFTNMWIKTEKNLFTHLLCSQFTVSMQFWVNHEWIPWMLYLKLFVRQASSIMKYFLEILFTIKLNCSVELLPHCINNTLWCRAARAVFFSFWFNYPNCKSLQERGCFFLTWKKKMAVDGILFASRVKMSLKTLMQQIVERERERKVCW